MKKLDFWKPGCAAIKHKDLFKARLFHLHTPTQSAHWRESHFSLVARGCGPSESTDTVTQTGTHSGT